jgi:hypothetical protein
VRELAAGAQSVEEAVRGKAGARASDALDSHLQALLDHVRSLPENAREAVSACCDLMHTRVPVGSDGAAMPGSALVAALREEGAVQSTFKVALAERRSETSKAAMASAGVLPEQTVDGVDARSDTTDELPDSADCADGWGDAGYVLTVQGTPEQDPTRPDVSSVLAWPAGTSEEDKALSPVAAAAARGMRAKVCVVRCEAGAGELVYTHAAVDVDGALLVTCTTRGARDDASAKPAASRALAASGSSGSTGVYVGGVTVDEASWQEPTTSNEDSSSLMDTLSNNLAFVGGGVVGAVALVTLLAVRRSRARAARRNRARAARAGAHSDDDIGEDMQFLGQENPLRARDMGHGPINYARPA